MIEQQRLIAPVRELCRRDRRIDAALMYGSFAQGTGDAHSDIEFWLFVDTAGAPIQPWTWCNQVSPVRHLVRNEFGAHVAFFAGLVRGEFHFAAVEDIATVGAWPARGAPTDRMIVVDRHDRLRRVLHTLPDRPATPRTWAEVEPVCGRFANWLVLAHHVAERGELLRALDALAHVRRDLLRMARLVEHRTDHWLTPSRRAEAELTPAAVDALRRTTAIADPLSVRAATAQAWICGREWWIHLATAHGGVVPQGLFADLDDTLHVRRGKRQLDEP